jgi:endonuclease-3
MPQATTALGHRSAFELLAATILSAQTTDAQVNRVTPELFKRYSTPKDLAAADLEALRRVVRGVNFYRTKGKNLKGMARVLLGKFGGKVPETMEGLLELPGVARKTANVVLGTWFKKPTGVVVDTHVQRISQRLGLTSEDKPEKIERDLTAALPEKEWIDFGHRAIWFGRKVCRARKPRCFECPLSGLCPFPDKTPHP